MLNENLIKYIKENKEKGFSDDVIKKALTDAGWKEEDINLVLSGPILPKPISKAPIFVIVVAWIMLLGGIFRLLISGPIMLLGFGLGSFSVVFASILAILVGIGLIVVSFGLRKMRKWGLYVFTIITGLSLISSIYSVASGSVKEVWFGMVVLVIQAAILIDFWTFSKKFV